MTGHLSRAVAERVIGRRYAEEPEMEAYHEAEVTGEVVGLRQIGEVQ